MEKSRWNARGKADFDGMQGSNTFVIAANDYP